MRRRISSAALPVHRHSIPQIAVDGVLVALDEQEVAGQPGALGELGEHVAQEQAAALRIPAGHIEQAVEAVVDAGGSESGHSRTVPAPIAHVGAPRRRSQAFHRGFTGR